MALIIDSDPGVGDAFALALALGHKIDVRAISTVFGNASAVDTHRNARTLAKLFGAGKVPVFAGAERPYGQPGPAVVRQENGTDGLSGIGKVASGVILSNPPQQERAVESVASILSADTGQSELVALGPLTNVADLLQQFPAVTQSISRIIVLGGALSTGDVSPCAEFNFWCDPEAANYVLRQKRVPVLVVPLDLTLRVAVFTRDWAAQLPSLGQAGFFLSQIVLPLIEHPESATPPGLAVLHGTVAMVEALRPGTIKSSPFIATVDTADGPARGRLNAWSIEPEDRLQSDTFAVQIAHSLSCTTDLPGSLLRAVANLARSTGNTQGLLANAASTSESIGTSPLHETPLHSDVRS